MRSIRSLADVREARRAGAAVEVLVRAADGQLGARSVQVDVEHAGGVRQVPDQQRAGRVGAGGLAYEVGDLGGAVVDERTHGDGDVVEPVETVADLAASRAGDAVDDVAVGRELAGGDGDDAPVGTQRERGVHELVQVDRRRVVDDDLAGFAHR